MLIAAEGVRDIDSSDDALSLFWPFVWPLLTLPALLGAKRSTIVTTACVLDIALVGLSLCWFANVLIWSSELRYGGVLLLLGYVGLPACALIALFWQWRERHSNDAGIVRRSP